MEDLEVYNKLLEEIEGHKFNTDGKCTYETHNSADGYPNGTPYCWRATVREFIDLQSCEAVLVLIEGPAKSVIKCEKPVHDVLIEHSGTKIINPDQLGSVGGSLTQKITWRTT